MSPLHPTTRVTRVGWRWGKMEKGRGMDGSDQLLNSRHQNKFRPRHGKFDFSHHGIRQLPPPKIERAVPGMKILIPT